MDFDVELDSFQDKLNEMHSHAEQELERLLQADSLEINDASRLCGEMLAIQQTVQQLHNVLDDWGFIEENEWEAVIDAYDADEYSLIQWSRENAALPKASGSMQAMVARLKEGLELSIEASSLVIEAVEFSKNILDGVQIGPLREGLISFVDKLDKLLLEEPTNANNNATKRIVYSALELH